ncbi:hypothetical protein RhiJN_22049 [Ceratobasidium sp. AG-Ba]|nr:hypothetical protein RhiJN_22049 [Ceratobasidium sp. AG-Ba]
MSGSSLRDLPPEIIRDHLAHLLEPRALLALGSTSRHFRNAMFGEDADEMLERYILEKRIPPRPKGFTYWKWLSFLHHPCCTVSGGGLYAPESDETLNNVYFRLFLCRNAVLGVVLLRMLSYEFGCVMSAVRFSEYFIWFCGRHMMLTREDLSLVQLDSTADEEMISILMYSKRIGSKRQRNRGINYSLRSEHDECVERIGQRKASGEAHVNWSEWVDECHERQEHARIVQEYVEWDRTTQERMWDQSKAAAEVSMFGLGLDLNQHYQRRWAGVSSWQGYPLSETVWTSLLPRLNNLRSKSKYARERHDLRLRREMKLMLQVHEAMYEEQSELARGLSDRLALAKLRMFLDWYPVPSFQDILALPAVENWLRCNDLPRNTDADSWTVEIPPKVSRAIEFLCHEGRHQIAEKVRIGRQSSGLDPNPPRPRFTRNSIGDTDPFEKVTRDVSLLHQKDNLFYRGEDPGTEVWSLRDILIELQEQDETIPQVLALDEYKFHTKASQILQYILPALPNQDVCFMEFETMVFQCYRCRTSDICGFEVIEHYLEAAERHEKIMARLEAVENEISPRYSFLHQVDTDDATPLAVVIEKIEVPRKDEKYEVACLVCQVAGVQDPTFRCWDPKVCMRMCRFHVREEHNVPHEEVDNYVQIS